MNDIEYKVSVPISSLSLEENILSKLIKFIDDPVSYDITIITKLPKKRNSVIKLPKDIYLSLKSLYPNQPIENIIYSIFKQKEDERYYGGLLFKSEEGWTREVCIPDIGYIDGYNFYLNKIVELKFLEGWKSALGQILAYGMSYPKAKKELWLLCSKTPKISQIKKIEFVCNNFNVHIEWINI